MTENTKTNNKVEETNENKATTVDDVISDIRGLIKTLQKYEVETTKVDLSQIPEYTLIQAMLKTNPDLDISAACKLLNITEDDTKKIIEVLDYYKKKDNTVELVATLMDTVKKYLIEKDLIQVLNTRTRAPSTSTGQRKKICGKFFANCPKCDYVAKGKERSLVTNQIKLHMMKEHGLTLEEFNELYRNTVNNSIQQDGETWVEYY